MKRYIFLLLTAAVAQAGLIVTTGANPGTTVNAIDLTGFSTTGSEMGGMIIEGLFVGGGTASCTWVDGAGQSGSCVASNGNFGFSIGLNGDTYTSSWFLSSITGANLLQLVFNGLPGSTVFDRTEPSTGTPGSDLGRDALGSTSSLIPSANVTYINQVATMGNAPVGDIYSTVQMYFGPITNVGLAPGETAEWLMDTDSIGIRGEIPEPSTFAMMGLALASLAFVRRRRS